MTKSSVERLDLYRRAGQLASLGNKITGKSYKISDMYSDLMEIHEEREERARERLPATETTGLPS